MNGLILNERVESYMNDLLPKRDAVLQRDGEACQAEGYPDHRPGLRESSLPHGEIDESAANFRDGIGDWVLDDLACARGRSARTRLLYRR